MLRIDDQDDKLFEDSLDKLAQDGLSNHYFHDIVKILEKEKGGWLGVLLKSYLTEERPHKKIIKRNQIMHYVDQTYRNESAIASLAMVAFIVLAMCVMFYFK